MNRTKGQVEAEISEIVIRFEKEYMGRGPLATKTYIIDDMVLVRLTGVMTQAEHQLSRMPDDPNGRDLIKKVRLILLEKGRPLLEAAIESALGCKVKSLHTDISTVSGERVIIFVLESALQFPSSDPR